METDLHLVLYPLGFIWMSLVWYSVGEISNALAVGADVAPEMIVRR